MQEPCPRRAAVLGFASLAVAALCLVAPVRAGEVEEGFEPLFNGKDLSGWKLVEGKDPGYLVEDGVIVCPKDGGGKLYTTKDYANFVLRFDYWVEPGGNNGIGIRLPDEGHPSYAGMEIQVLDDYADKYANLRPGQYHGSVYDVVPAKRGAPKPAGEWNSEEIRIEDGHIRVTVNDKVIVDANLDEVTDPKVLEKHPGIRRRTGKIALLGHNAHVKFRNVRIKELP